jgi:hypothetical protein
VSWSARPQRRRSGPAATRRSRVRRLSSSRAESDDSQTTLPWTGATTAHRSATCSPGRRRGHASPKPFDTGLPTGHARCGPRDARRRAGSRCLPGSPAMSIPDNPDSVQPALRRAEAKLARHLEEACEDHDRENIGEESTDELLRLEEELLAAARAVDEAVRLRRKLGDEKGPAEQSTPAPDPAPFVSLERRPAASGEYGRFGRAQAAARERSSSIRSTTSTGGSHSNCCRANSASGCPSSPLSGPTRRTPTWSDCWTKRSTFRSESAPYRASPTPACELTRAHKPATRPYCSFVLKCSLRSRQPSGVRWSTIVIAPLS